MEIIMLLKGKCNFKNKYQSPFKDSMELGKLPEHLEEWRKIVEKLGNDINES